MDAETSRLLTETQAGTPMGEWLRRYWWPVAIADTLKDKPTFIRILNQDLVLFRDGNGEIGLVDAQCPHRRANLCLGNTEEKGLRCRYHGWLIRTDGQVLETPGEPDDSFAQSVRTGAYPVAELAGLVYAYFGPDDQRPPLPQFDFLAGPGTHLVAFCGITQANWLQVAENSMDPIHLSFTHRPSATMLRAVPESWFHETEEGVAYVALRKTDTEGKWQVRVNNLLLPSIGSSGGIGFWVEGSTGADRPPVGTRINVPIDEESTLIFRLLWLPPGWEHVIDRLGDAPEALAWDAQWRAITIEPFHELKVNAATGEPIKLGYDIPVGAGWEDGTVVSSLPARVDRENEHPLPTGDGGLTFIRDVILKSVTQVQEGGAAKGVHPEHDDGIITMTTGDRFITAEGAELIRGGLSFDEILALPDYDDVVTATR